MLSEVALRRFPAVWALLLGCSALASTTVVRGTLIPPVAGEPLQLILASGMTVELELDRGLELTMRDPQLVRRIWELRGQARDEGRFAVDRIFTVKDGVLHRVTYYCEICHITTHEPGPCMCCQGDTDLRELAGE